MEPGREARWRRWLARGAAAIAALPLGLRVVLFLAAILHGVGISWGLPASDGWDNDGIAPRDILPGIASTYSPGDFYTYPPAHLLLLALVTLPVTVIAVARAPSLRVPDVIHEILAPGYMTAFTLAARLAALVMSVGIALALAKIAEEIVGREDPARARRVGIFTAATASVGVTFTYYAHTSNLDVPSLFWATLAALELVRTVSRREPRRLRRAAITAALAIATKDQTYALFLVAGPAIVAGWALVDRWPRANARTVLRELGVAVAVGAVLLAVVDGMVTNPTGFRARVAFLRGPASQDFSNFARGLDGIAAIFAAIPSELPRHYPLAFGGFLLAGTALALRQGALRGEPADRRPVLLAAVPLLFALSFTIGFNLAARRIDDRFLLPQMLFAAVYAGIAIERLWDLGKVSGGRGAIRLACLAAFAMALWEAIRVDATFVYEPRYATEAFLAAHVNPGDTIEVHGLNAYLPRFPPGAHVVRVGPRPVRMRGPLPGVEEVEGRFLDIDQRRPRFVVVSTCYAWRYLPQDTSSHDGRIYPASQMREANDPDATRFFTGLFEGRLGYRKVHDSKIGDDRWFRPIEFHASLNCRTTTFERTDDDRQSFFPPQGTSGSRASRR